MRGLAARSDGCCSAPRPAPRSRSPTCSRNRPRSAGAVLGGHDRAGGGLCAGPSLTRSRKLPFVTPVGLGPRILRADTAALAALACWQAIVGRRGQTARRFAAPRHRRGQGASMSAPPKDRAANRSPSKRQLVEYIAAGCEAARASGASAPSTRSSPSTSTICAPLPYEGPRGIRALLRGPDALRLGAGLGGRQRHRAHRRRLQHHARAGRPVRAVGRAAGEHCTRPAPRCSRHLDQVKAGRRRARHRHARHGLPAEMARADIHWMPKGRYKIMRDYMPKKGKLGLDMMTAHLHGAGESRFRHPKPTW